MALIACPDCKTEVSELAPACPKCARPLEAGQKSFATKSLGLGGVIYTGLFIGGLVLFGRGDFTPGVVLMAIGAVLLIARLRMWSGVDRK